MSKVSSSSASSVAVAVVVVREVVVNVPVVRELGKVLVGKRLVTVNVRRLVVDVFVAVDVVDGVAVRVAVKVEVPRVVV